AIPPGRRYSDGTCRGRTCPLHRSVLCVLHTAAERVALQHIARGDGPEHLQQCGDEAGPSGLVAGAEAGAVVAVEVLVKEDEVPPVRIVLELPRVSVDRPPPRCSAFMVSAPRCITRSGS